MKKVILFLILTLFLLPKLASAALDIKISAKDSFSIGETVSFDYTITSGTDQQIVFTPHITCPSAPVAFLEEKTAQLQAGMPYRDTYTAIEVDDSIEPQTCTAYIRVTSPVQQTASKEFKIATNPSFEFQLKTCQDQECSKPSKTFVLNENIYFDYQASVEKPTIKAILTLPDKTTREIGLPSLIKAEQVGTYEIEVTASKKGYKTITKKEQFAVLEEEPEVPPTAGKCNANGICDNEENLQNCPQDCVKKNLTPYFIALGMLGLILLFIAAWLAFIKKSKS